MTTTTTTNDQGRKYLMDAVYFARHEKYKEIDKACHISPVKPASPHQLVEWIKADKFTFNKEIDPKEPMSYMGDIYGAIDFRDQDPDYIKRAASYKKLDEDYDALKLRINVLDPEKTITEVESFKKRTYH